MRYAVALLLLCLCAAADEPTFEVKLPAGDDWEARTPQGEGVKACYRTEFGDAPEEGAEVQVLTQPLTTELAKKSLDAIAHDWAPTVENEWKAESLDESASKLGAEEAWCRDLHAGWSRLTWYLSRKDGVLYTIRVVRTGRAVSDEKIGKEIASILASFKFPKLAPPATPPPPEPPIVKAERETLTLPYWRLECVKPEGLVSIPQKDLAQAEKDAGVVAKFEGKGEQTVLMVRIYAQSRAMEKLTIEQLAEQKLKRFTEDYPETSRNEPKRDDGFKFPLAERAIRLDLTGRDRTLVVTTWILAECRNERQYQVEIYNAGGDPGHWSKEIEEILKGLQPKRR